MKIELFHDRCMKKTKFLEFHSRITNNNENLKIQRRNYENNVIPRIPCQSNENHENLIILHHNHENHEIPKVPC